MRENSIHESVCPWRTRTRNPARNRLPKPTRLPVSPQGHAGDERGPVDSRSRSPFPESYLESPLSNSVSREMRGVTKNHFPRLFLYRWSSLPCVKANRMPANEASFSVSVAAKSLISEGVAPRWPRSFSTRSIRAFAVPLGARSFCSGGVSLSDVSWPLAAGEGCAAAMILAIVSFSPR